MIYKNSSTNKWCNYTLSGFTINDSTQTISITAGSTTLASDTDASVSSITNNQGLIYNSGTSKWTNQQIDHTTLANIGTHNLAQIDTHIGASSDVNLEKEVCGNYI